LAVSGCGGSGGEDGKSPEALNGQILHLELGVSVDEVKDQLGEPDVESSVGSNDELSYGIWQLAFVDGGLKTRSKVIVPKGAPRGSMETCLLQAGAAKAGSVGQLGFIKRAEEEDEVAKPGFVWDKVTRTFVWLWETASSEGRPPKWAIWFGQPFGGDLEPFEIIEEDPPKTFVLFVRNPTPTQWKKMNWCPGQPPDRVLTE